MIIISYFFFFFFFLGSPYPLPPSFFFLFTTLKKQYWFLKLIDLSLNSIILKYEISIIYLSCSIKNYLQISQNFEKTDFLIYPNILYIFDQNFMLVPTIKLLEFSDKNWETYKRLLIFWSIFWLFFLSSKVSKMKFHQKSLIYKNTTLYDIDFYQKIRILRFFLRKFLLTVFRIFH